MDSGSRDHLEDFGPGRTPGHASNRLRSRHPRDHDHGCAHALDPVPADDAPTTADVPDAGPTAPMLMPTDGAAPTAPSHDDSGRDANDAATDAQPDAQDGATDALDAGPAPSHANDPTVPPPAGSRIVRADTSPTPLADAHV
jgi:hypothetical protein